MRIGLEVSSLAAPYPTGIARYMQALAKALQQACPDDQLSIWYRLSRLRNSRHWWRPKGLPARTWQGRWWPPMHGLDLIHGLDGVVPGWRSLPRVATLHDLTTLRQRDVATASRRFRRHKLARYREMAARADRVIAVSNATKHDAVDLLGLTPERIRVVPLGVDRRFHEARPDPAVQARLGLRHGYVLFVGIVSQRKNTERLVRAFARSRAAGGRQLVLAGRFYHRSEATRQAAVESCAPGSVVFAGHVPDGDLPALYAGAAALVFPTLYEGFGLPVLEAMAAGVPVLCGDRGAAPETACGLAVLVDPTDTDAIAHGIDRVLNNPPADADSLKRHAAGFTWQRTAVLTAAIYRELVE